MEIDSVREIVLLAVALVYLCPAFAVALIVGLMGR